jgi:hypothetical protein
MGLESCSYLHRGFNFRLAYVIIVIAINFNYLVL